MTYLFYLHILLIYLISLYMNDNYQMTDTASYRVSMTTLGQRENLYLTQPIWNASIISDCTMLFLTVTTCLVMAVQAGCPMRPTAEQTSAPRTTGDGGYRILVSGKADKYIPNAVYTISLQGNDVYPVFIGFPFKDRDIYSVQPYNLTCSTTKVSCLTIYTFQKVNNLLELGPH